jgi:hypothetical protein
VREGAYVARALPFAKKLEFRWHETYVAGELKLSGSAARSSYRVVSRLGRQVSRQARQISIWAVLFVLCLGLPRFLVVCTGPHCQGSVEFVHAPGSCCQDHHEVPDGCSGHEHGDNDADGGDCGEGESAEPSRCGCTDVAFVIDEGPLPERITFEFSDAPVVAVIDSWPDYRPTEHLAAALPPATGPPRTDQRTELLATTLLLI